MVSSVCTCDPFDPIAEDLEKILGDAARTRSGVKLPKDACSCLSLQTKSGITSRILQGFYSESGL